MTFDGISKSIVSKFFEKARTSTIIENMQILRVSFNSSGLPEIKVRLAFSVLKSKRFLDSVVVQRQAIVCSICSIKKL